MSLLTPLYIAGLLAVSLPVLFHLIRRTPKGQVPFSSLMFLSPSPPRVTRRSRLDHILLLILRGLALSLLAFAFARPFLRDAASLEISDQPSRRIVLLVDRSASMRRGNLWQQAKAKAEQALGDVTPADQVALVSFADSLETHISFENWNETDPARRTALVKSALEPLSPSWGATQLGDALMASADLLADVPDDTDASADAARQVILISDLQTGAHLESLQAYAWPKGVTLDVRAVAPKSPANAGLHLAGDDGSLHVDNSLRELESDSRSESSTMTADGPLRVRVSNEADSPVEQFTLQWATEKADLATSEPVKAYVPAGASRVVRVPRPKDARAADRLVLRGDDVDFDNTLYLATPRQEEIVVAYFGVDAADDIKGLRYYLDRAFVDTPRWKVRIVANSLPELESAKLAIVTNSVQETGSDSRNESTTLQKYIAGDGTLLVVLQDTEAALLAELIDLPALTIEEATGKDYALLGELAYTHPLFAPFADPRFGDFTKIHFWKHRRVKLPPEAKVNVLARFDNGDPAVFEKAIGPGSVVVFASSWRPVDSQLAMSSKFVPLLSGLLDRYGTENEKTQFTVGDDVPTESGKPSPTLRPGVFLIGDQRFAVNVSADESRTAPLGLEELEQRGARLSSEESRAADVERRRQLRVAELENRQKLWRWLIVAVLGLVICETALAGRLTKKTMSETS